MAPTFRRLDLVAAQSEECAERFRRLGADPASVRVTGSLKFDGLQTDRSNRWTSELATMAAFDTSHVVLLAGSTQAPEEQLAIASFAKLAGEFPQLRLALAPRHPHRFEEVAQLLRHCGLAWQRRSLLSGKERGASARILLIDTVGELAAWWGTADIAFVGGSLGNRGGQNMMEPAAYGAALSFGPNTHNFREIAELLLQHDAAVVVHDGEQLTEFVRRCLTNPEWGRIRGARARQLVMSQKGAADSTIDLLGQFIESDMRAAAKQSAA
jgi:3-deoxy-D-manno-octulosonic-acid transferase